MRPQGDAPGHQGQAGYRSQQNLPKTSTSERKTGTTNTGRKEKAGQKEKAAASSKRKPREDFLRVTDRHNPGPDREGRRKSLNLEERSRSAESGRSFTESELIDRLEAEQQRLLGVASSCEDSEAEPGLDDRPQRRTATQQKSNSKKVQEAPRPIPAYTSASI